MTFVLDSGIVSRLCHPAKKQYRPVGRWIRGDIEREPFSEAMLRLIEDLIRFLRKDRVAVRLYEGGYRRDGWNAKTCA